MTNQSFAGKRSFRTILTIVIALVLLVTMFAGTAFAKTSDDIFPDYLPWCGAKSISTSGQSTFPLIFSRNTFSISPSQIAFTPLLTE